MAKKTEESAKRKFAEKKERLKRYHGLLPTRDAVRRELRQMLAGEKYNKVTYDGLLISDGCPAEEEINGKIVTVGWMIDPGHVGRAYTVHGLNRQQDFSLVYYFNLDPRTSEVLTFSQATPGDGEGWREMNAIEAMAYLGKE